MSNAVLEKISVHSIGNKGKGQKLKASRKPLSLSAEEKNTFLRPFWDDLILSRTSTPFIILPLFNTTRSSITVLK